LPNKTIYVAEADLPLLDRAQQIAGSLSAAIVTALRQYVAAAGARQRGFQEITVVVGSGGAYRRKRFLGALLARGQRSSSDNRVEVLWVYQSARDHLVLHGRRSPAWWNAGVASSAEPAAASGGDRDWSEPAEYRLEIYEHVEALRGQVPDELYAVVVDALRSEPIEVLDI
jgi:EXLDI family protein